MMQEHEIAAAPLVIARQGYFFVGGEYFIASGERFMSGQMYVEFQIPFERTQPFPIVMWHGNWQTGVNFTGTPDGREGWAQFFLRRGYAVYVVDQPGRGRSAYHPDVCGPQSRKSTTAIEKRFIAPEHAKLWPQAHLHTQWPGSGVAGDPVFDQFYAQEVPAMESIDQTQAMNRDAGAALLDRIGPAVLLTHSQSGTYGWLVGDSRPDLVKAIVAVEPSGPPVYEASYANNDTVRSKPWGLASEPLAYSPAVKSAHELSFERQSEPDGPNLAKCWLQQEPARELVNLKKIPVLVVTGEASYHAPYDHCTARYLTQAGVRTTFMPLAERGCAGNGHMMMLEKNHFAIAALIAEWIEQNVNA